MDFNILLPYVCLWQLFNQHKWSRFTFYFICQVSTQNITFRKRETQLMRNNDKPLTITTPTGDAISADCINREIFSDIMPAKHCLDNQLFTSVQMFNMEILLTCKSSLLHFRHLYFLHYMKLRNYHYTVQQFMESVMNQYIISQGPTTLHAWSIKCAK